MKELRVEVSDEEFATLEQLARAFGVSVEEMLKRTVAAYRLQNENESIWNPALEQLARAFGVSVEEMLKRTVAAYRLQNENENVWNSAR